MFLVALPRGYLVAIFSETCALIPRKYVVEQVMSVLKSSEKHKLLWSQSSVLNLEYNSVKKANF